MAEAVEVSHRGGLIGHDCVVPRPPGLARPAAGTVRPGAAARRAAVGQARRVPQAWFGPTADALLAGTMLDCGDAAGAAACSDALDAAGPEGAEAYRLRCLAPLAEATGIRPCSRRPSAARRDRDAARRRPSCSARTPTSASPARGCSPATRAGPAPCSRPCWRPRGAWSGSRCWSRPGSSTPTPRRRWATAAPRRRPSEAADASPSSRDGRALQDALQHPCNTAPEGGSCTAHRMTGAGPWQWTRTRLNEFVGRFVADLGATMAAGNVVVGHRLGLYRALAQGPATPEELAERADCHPRYLTEWLRGQAAGGYVTYDPADGRYAHDRGAGLRARRPGRPALRCRGRSCWRWARCGPSRGSPRRSAPGRASAGTSTTRTCSPAASCSSGPGYLANLAASWIPALDGVEARLAAGARVADVGCGLGASTVLLAQAYPQARIAGSDYHDRSIELARKRAADAGVADRVSFEVASAQTFPGRGYDLVTTFDCLHDMGDPLGAARHVREALAPDGTWMIVEPAAGDRVEDNLNPVGRVVLLVLDVPLRAERAVPGRRLRARARRRARPRSGRSSPTPGSPGSGGRRRRRSTSSTRSGRDHAV